jgi:predicted NBD/HSP70 family sugar kinase
MLGAASLPIRDMIRFMPFKTEVDGGSRLAGFAESWGQNRLGNALFLMIDQGVAGAVIIGGNICEGCNERCGEFGHITVVKDGLPCSCGKKGCLEAYCATTRLSGEGDIGDFFAGLDRGEERNQAVWED